MVKSYFRSRDIEDSLFCNYDVTGAKMDFLSIILGNKSQKIFISKKYISRITFFGVNLPLGWGLFLKELTQETCLSAKLIIVEEGTFDFVK